MARRYIRHEPTMGSISSGTMRTEGLLPAFADELEWLRPRGYGKLLREAETVDLESEDADGVLEDLVCALEELAPPFLYFGAHYGDGGCYGWWPDMDAIEELPQFDDTDGAREEGFYGEFKTVTDHGNVTVWVRYGNGRIREILGIV